MKQAKFYLESRKDREGNPITHNVPIRLSFHFGERLEYYTGIRISNSKNFNKDYFKTGKSPIKPNEPEASRINKRLKDLKAKAELLHDNLIALGQVPTASYIKEKLDEQFKNKSEDERELLVKDAFKEFLDQIKEKKSYRTWQKFNTTFNHLSNAFSKEFDRITFKEIDTPFVEKYRKGIIKQGFKEKDEKKAYLNNTIVKYLRSFKEFLNWCKDEERQYYKGNAKFNDVKENEIDIIYLNAEQMQKFIDADMPTPTLQKVKDVFLFGWYTGMRYGNLRKLMKVNVEKDYIRFYIAKGTHTTWHEVPLVKGAKEILKKYENTNDDAALPVLSNQKMNEYIKKAMKLAGINNIIPLRHLRADGTFEERQYELWELVTCHTSRKSFITLAVERGMQEIDIKSITAHSKNSRAFARYYEVSAEKKKREMNKIFAKEIS